ncbi:MAG: CvpA family protein [Anaerolineae bacterium]
MPAEAAYVPVNAYVLIAAALAVFGSIGFRRGVNRELVTFIAVLVALAITSLFTDALVPAVNRMNRVSHFALSGGLSGANTSESWNAANQVPDLVGSPASKAVLELMLFMLPVLISYVIGMRFKGAINTGQKLLGMLMGCVTGFFIAQHFSPILFPAGQTALVLATGSTNSLLQNTQVVAVLVVVTVVILVAFGLYSSRHVVKR